MISALFVVFKEEENWLEYAECLLILMIYSRSARGKTVLPLKLGRANKYTLEELDKHLMLKRGHIHSLWTKAILNTFKSKFESLQSLKSYLVDMTNKMLEEPSRIPMHPIHFLFYWCVFNDWNMHINVLKEKIANVSREDKEALDNSLMRFYRDFIVKRDNNQCQMCGNFVTLKTAHVHHIWHYSRKLWPKHGGPSTILNLITLCKECHSLVHPFLYIERDRR